MRILFLLLLSFPAYGGHFAGHVKQSLRINHAMKPLYHELTAGRSDELFNGLIFVERAMLPLVWPYDLRARWFQKRGLPLLREEFLPLKESRDVPRVEVSEDFRPVAWETYREELGSLIKARKLEELKRHGLQLLAELSSQSSYHCLTRHLIESLYRIAHFLPQRVEEARQLGISSPEKLIWDLLDFHLVAFPHFTRLDLRAAPLQKEGFPVFCHELPDLLEDIQLPSL